jgi:hypothetical protein
MLPMNTIRVLAVSVAAAECDPASTVMGKGASSAWRFRTMSLVEKFAERVAAPA